MVSEAKGQMVLLPERCTKTRLITSLLFYLGLFYLLFFLSSLIYSSTHWRTENSSSCSSDSYSNPNPYKHTAQLSALKFQEFCCGFGGLFFFFF